MKVLIGIVLAAGKGKRLCPLTETRPKILLPILGQPVIYRHIDLLKKLGIDKVVVVVSHFREKVVEVVKDIANDIGVEVDFVDQKEELGTGHAVKVVLRKYEDDAVISYGDIYIQHTKLLPSLIDVVRRKDNYIVGVEVGDISRYGKLIVDGDRVLGVIEKPSEGGRGLINAGIYVVKGSVLKLVEEIGLSPRREYELTDLISIANEKGYTFKFIKIESEWWQDIGYPWDFLKSVKLELSDIRSRVIKGEIDHSVTIKGAVVVDEGAVVKGSTYIEGPVYIGKDTVIGPNSYLRPYTSIERGSHIGFSVEVKESIVLEKSHAAHLTYIGDSIIGENVNLGAGTLIANLRFDEKTVKVSIDGIRIDTGRRKMGAIIGGYVRTGVNVSIMPGVKIGSYSIIYPGVTVYRDIPPNAIVDRDWI
ncbi:MAG: sugar phosphate nucleotidyltransferase [Ignisphaera sp.]|uniref:Nucleotidyl transferase n=1 Tax=Ignisphaera aggregans TaxID=334771 RepID=A0A7J3N043_9CREN